MKTDNIAAATKARERFFDILNRVLYDDETFYITKAGADSLVKLEKVPPGRETLAALAGSIGKKDAALIKKAVANARTYSKRKVLSFN